MVTSSVIGISPLVSRIVPVAPAPVKVTVSAPAVPFALVTACLSDPAPVLVVLETVKFAASAAGATMTAAPIAAPTEPAALRATCRRLLRCASRS